MQVHLSTVPARVRLFLSLSLFLPFPTVYLFLPSLLSFFGSTDAQIKGDSGRAASPFRMKRPRLLLFHSFLFPLSLLSAPG